MKNFGRNAQDKITGFKGIITGKALYLYGCAQYCLVGKVNKEGKNESNWYDDGRIKILKGGVSAKSVKSDNGDGPESRDDSPPIY